MAGGQGKGVEIHGGVGGWVTRSGHGGASSTKKVACVLQTSKVFGGVWGGSLPFPFFRLYICVFSSGWVRSIYIYFLYLRFWGYLLQIGHDRDTGN